MIENFSLKDIIQPYEPMLLNDATFINNLFNISETDSRKISFSFLLDVLISEAEYTLQMIKPFLYPGAKILEIGGGVGLTYVYLRSLGHDVRSIEPGAEEFGDRYHAGLRIINIIGIDSIGWIKSGIESFAVDQRFDLIFSHFVLEHIRDLDQAFRVMHELLSPNGIMIHRCPNYSVPFESHLNMPLVPFYPKLTSLLIPKLKKNAVWQGLQFTTTRIISNLCTENDMNVVFSQGMLANAFERLFTDPIFAARKKVIFRVAKFLRAIGVIDLLQYLPPALSTPMEFIARRKK